jgi:transcriptional regulator with XRE-family HTH domain
MNFTPSDIIRAARQARGFSQEYIALKLGVTQQTFSNLEKNPVVASLGRLRELAKILDVDIVTLIGEASSMVQTNLNQQGGNAASSMIFNQIAQTNKPLRKRCSTTSRKKSNSSGSSL